MFDARGARNVNGREDPALQGRRLRTELRRLRIELDLSQKDVAENLDWSTSKILRIENGTVGVSTTDLRALLEHYGVRDPGRVGELTRMAQVARRQTWRDYRDVLSTEFIRYLGYESSAHVIRNFVSLYVPGLLQTPEYAKEIMRQFAPDAPDSLVERRVLSRIQRQQLIGRPDAPKMFFIVDEAVILRWVGGASVMRRQLRHLRLMEKHPEVTIQVIKFESGRCVSVAGAFAHLQFPDPGDRDLLYIENVQGDVFLRDDEEGVSSYLLAFLELEKVATAPDRFGDVVDDALDTIPDRATPA
jgi:transcriptional regulator with XRE-family HTH domain